MAPRRRGRGPKKWLMLQMWRVQQISQILSLVMIAATDALLVYDYMKWREGSLFSTPYIGVPLLLLFIIAIIWGVSIVWDIRLKMWREQVTVVFEKNPFTKEKMTPKEIVIYGTVWLPLMERMGEDDPKLKASADALRTWLLRSMEDDLVTEKEVSLIRRYIGSSEEHSSIPKVKEDT